MEEMKEDRRKDSLEILEGLKRNCFIYPEETKAPLSLKDWVKRFLKKGTSFYVNPIVRSQCCYNSYVLEAISFLLDYCNSMQEEIDRLQNELKK